MAVRQIIEFCIVTTGLALAVIATPAQSQNDLLGHHTINLRLKPMPAAQVLELLSARSHVMAKLKDAPADEGRPWTVEGASLLEGVTVKVEFVETPTHEAVSRLLGCIGFGYEERSDRIRIVSADTWPADRCRGVERVATASAKTESARDPNKTYSWNFASISAFDFARHWATDTDRNVVVPNRENEEFKRIMLNVQLNNVRPQEALQALVRCIGYVVEARGDGFIITTSEDEEPGSCHGFAVLGAQ